jgi:transcription antitermination protein NusB
VSDLGGRGRRAARERALELLYEAEAKDVPPAELVAGLPLRPDRYAEEIVVGVGADGARIDAVLSRTAKGWRLERMPAIDRSVLRMAAWELAHRRDVPTAVVISEAVELAKQYSTDDSGRFVNGVLSRVAEELRAEPEAGDEPEPKAEPQPEAGGERPDAAPRP